MAKPKCLVFAAPFGFGPAAKTIRIISSLHDICDFIVVSKGNALDFLLKHRVGNTKYFSGMSSVFNDPAQLSGFGMAISINNVPAAHRLKALGFGKRTVMIDSLHEWRTEIRAEFPPSGLLATLVEDSLPGFEMSKSLPETCTPISTILTIHRSSDIVPKTPIYETLFHFGGVLSPVLEGKPTVQKLERWIRTLVCGADFIAGRRVALGKLPPMDISAVPDNVDWFAEVQPNEVYGLIKASRQIVTTPGAGFLEMAFLTQRPTLMLPPMNSTQLMHYSRLAALGFPGVLSAKALEEILDQTDNLPWHRHADLLVNWLLDHRHSIVTGLAQAHSELSGWRGRALVARQTERVQSLEKTDGIAVLRGLSEKILSGSSV